MKIIVLLITSLWFMLTGGYAHATLRCYSDNYGNTTCYDSDNGERTHCYTDDYGNTTCN